MPRVVVEGGVMARKFKVLDLFCGAGGAAMGLHRVWPDAEITGIDIRPQIRYPFRFVQADAMTFPLDDYDFIWASPPCQGYSQTNHIHHCQRRPYPRLIEKLRQRLRTTTSRWVIENVVGAPLISPVILCGTMLGLSLRRHRLFETSFLVSDTPVCQHGADYGVYAGKVTKVGTRAAAYVAGSGRTHYRPQTATKNEGQAAMGIDWMTLNELSQAVPPAYSEWIARHTTPQLEDNHQ
jgi:DNA (cytosine-5)-methyltransferase 1